jgi:hypothetical protein
MSRKVVEEIIGGHDYQIVLYDFDYCFDLGMEIADGVGGPIGEVFKGMLLGSGEDLDWEKIGDSLKDLPAGIMKAGGSEMVAKIFKGTTRLDGEKQRLWESDARNKAFGQGNMFEAFEALYKVLELNFGPFLSRLQAKWMELDSSQDESGPESQATQTHK